MLPDAVRLPVMTPPADEVVRLSAPPDLASSFHHSARPFGVVTRTSWPRSAGRTDRSGNRAQGAISRSAPVVAGHPRVRRNTPAEQAPTVLGHPRGIVRAHTHVAADLCRRRISPSTSPMRRRRCSRRSIRRQLTRCPTNGHLLRRGRRRGTGPINFGGTQHDAPSVTTDFNPGNRSNAPLNKMRIGRCVQNTTRRVMPMNIPPWRPSPE